MVISQNGAGHLQIHVDWPSSLRNKGVFFVKRDAEPLPEGDGIDLSDFLACGDIHPNVLGKLWYLCLYLYVRGLYRSFLCLGGGGAGAHLSQRGQHEQVPRVRLIWSVASYVYALSGISYFNLTNNFFSTQTFPNKCTSWPPLFTRSGDTSRA